MQAKKKPEPEIKKPMTVCNMADILIKLGDYNHIPLFFELTKTPNYDSHEEQYDNPIVNEISGINVEIHKDTAEPIRVIIRL